MFYLLTSFSSPVSHWPRFSAWRAVSPHFGVYHLTPSSLLESLIPPPQSDASAKPKADGQWSVGEVPTKIGGGSRRKCEEERAQCLSQPGGSCPTVCWAVHLSPLSGLDDLIIYRVSVADDFYSVILGGTLQIIEHSSWQSTALGPNSACSLFL